MMMGNISYSNLCDLFKTGREYVWLNIPNIQSGVRVRILKTSDYEKLIFTSIDSLFLVTK